MSTPEPAIKIVDFYHQNEYQHFDAVQVVTSDRKEVRKLSAPEVLVLTYLFGMYERGFAAVRDVDISNWVHNAQAGAAVKSLTANQVIEENLGPDGRLYYSLNPQFVFANPGAISSKWPTDNDIPEGDPPMVVKLGLNGSGAFLNRIEKVSYFDPNRSVSDTIRSVRTRSRWSPWGWVACEVAWGHVAAFLWIMKSRGFADSIRAKALTHWLEKFAKVAPAIGDSSSMLGYMVQRGIIEIEDCEGDDIVRLRPGVLVFGAHELFHTKPEFYSDYWIYSDYWKRYLPKEEKPQRSGFFDLHAPIRRDPKIDPFETAETTLGVEKIEDTVHEIVHKIVKPEALVSESSSSKEGRFLILINISFFDPKNTVPTRGTGMKQRPHLRLRFEKMVSNSDILEANQFRLDAGDGMSFPFEITERKGFDLHRNVRIIGVDCKRNVMWLDEMRKRFLNAGFEITLEKELEL